VSKQVREIFVLAGPNGAGKTTAAKSLLPARLSVTQFVNADEIARGLSPNDVESASVAAARAMLTRMAELLSNGTSFAFETTLSGQSHGHFLSRAKQSGWEISLLFLWLPSPEVALERVARRVLEGGHDIPREVVIRRYWKGIENFRSFYLALAHTAAVYDNSDSGPRIVARRTKDGRLSVCDDDVWSMITRATK
jgi:predicted ABC-type ATPase